MGAAEILLLGVGLSMDAFAAALCKGIAMERIDVRHTFTIGIFFGGFQALMPCMGWILGSGMRDYIVNIDHWIAFALLAFIGGKMIYDSVCDNKAEVTVSSKADIRELTFLAVATSIDALAVGVTLSFLNVSVVFASLIIGSVTFMLSCVGVCTGYIFGSRFEKHASIAGGIILILIGLKILAEHTIN